jgi:site-specific DNA-cytosine methylase
MKKPCKARVSAQMSFLDDGAPRPPAPSTLDPERAAAVAARAAEYWARRRADDGSIVFRVFCPFGGCGGGALGFQHSLSQLFGIKARFELVGGVDVVPRLCRDFEYLTGVAEVCADIAKMTPEELRAACGGEAPDIIFGSPPCKGSSKLLPNRRSREAKYQMMNELALVLYRLVRAAFPDRPPPLFLYENVPNITYRARPMLEELRRMMVEDDYAIQDGYHQCRKVGNLAQNRERWFMVGRHKAQVPFFLYRPEDKPGLVCGDVLGPLPLPGDPAGGAMHEEPNIHLINLLRLWAIRAGRDHRDLRRDQSVSRRTLFRRLPVADWTLPSETVTGHGGSGLYGVQDPRGGIELGYGARLPYHHVDHVTPWTGIAGTVTHSPAPSSGGGAVADPRVLVPLVLEDGAPRFNGALGVLSLSAVVASVTAEAYPTTGTFSVADPRPIDLSPEQGAWFGGSFGVLPMNSVAASVTARACPSTGMFSIADPRPIDLDRHLGAHAFNHIDKVGVWTMPTCAVTTARRPGGGALSVADPRPVDLVRQVAFHHVDRVVHWYGVTGTVTAASGPGRGAVSAADPRIDLVRGVHRHKNVDRVTAWAEPTGTIIGAAAPSGGAPAVAQPFVPVDLVPQRDNPRPHDNKYLVVAWNGPAKTITTSDRVGSGAASIADPRIELATGGKRFHEGAGPGRWGVLAVDSIASTVTGNARPSTGPFAVAGPAPIDLCPRVTPMHDRAYGVLGNNNVIHCIAGASAVGCGAYARAVDPPIVPRQPIDLSFGCNPRQGSYGVYSMERPAKTVIASASIDCTTCAVAAPQPPPPYIILPCEDVRRIVAGEIPIPFAVVDPARPNEPLAICDSLKRAPFRWEMVKGPKGRAKAKRVPVTLVFISDDGCWHRALTTLELAALQGFPMLVRGKPICFEGGAIHQREAIGNAVPPPVARSIGNQMLLALIAAFCGKTYTFSTAVWAEQGVMPVDPDQLWGIGDYSMDRRGQIVRVKRGAHPRPKACAPRRASPAARATLQ